MADRPRLSSAALTAAGAALAVLPLAMSFVDDTPALALTVVAAAGCAALTTFAPVRLPQAAQVGVPLAALAVVGLVVTEASTLWLDHVSLSLPEVWALVTRSWNTTRAADVPAPVRPGLAVLPALLAAAAASVAGLAARVSQRAMAIAPLLVAFGASLSLSGGGAPSPLVPVLLALVCLALAVPHGRDRLVPAGWWRRAGAVGLGTAIAVGSTSTAAGVTGLAGEHRADLRASYEPPVTRLGEPHVLNLVARGLSTRSQPPTVFEVELELDAGVLPHVRRERVRLAVLDDYDGTTWTSTGTFTAVGESGESPDNPSPPADATEGRIVQTYMVEAGLGTAYVPSLGEPVALQQLDGPSIGRDQEHGTLAVLGPPGAVRYRVTSDVGISPDERRAQARAAQPSATTRPIEPGAWAAYLERLPDGSAFEQLEAIEDDLSSRRFGYDLDAAPGHSMGRLTQFLGIRVGDVPAIPAADRIGTSEQPAAAFAVLARMLGHDSRVVVGYRLPPEAYGGGGSVAVRADQIHAWAEVRFDSLGWVEFDPTDPTPRQPPWAPNSGSDDVPPTPSTTAPPGPVPPTTVPDGGDDNPPLRAEHWPWLLLALALAGLAAMVGPAGARTLRRLDRRFRGPADRRAVGAWHEIRDRLQRHGLVLSPSATPADVARACQPDATVSRPFVPSSATPEPTVPGRWGPVLRRQLAESTTTLATVVDTALHAEAPPDASLVDQAWGLDRRVRSAFAGHRRSRRRTRRQPRHPSERGTGAQ